MNIENTKAPSGNNHLTTMTKWFSFNEKTQKVEEVSPSEEIFKNTSLLYWTRGMESWEKGEEALKIFLAPPPLPVIHEEPKIEEIVEVAPNPSMDEIADMALSGQEVAQFFSEPVLKKPITKTVTRKNKKVSKKIKKKKSKQIKTKNKKKSKHKKKK